MIIILIVLIQTALIVLDLKKAIKNTADSQKAFTYFGILGLAFTIVVYGTLHIVGVSILPRTEVIIDNLSKALPLKALMQINNLLPKSCVSIVLTIVTFYTISLMDYLVHRFLSHNRYYFHTHRYHHLPKKIYLFLPGILVRPYVVAALFPILIGTATVLSVLFQVLGVSSQNIVNLFSIVLLLQSTIGAVTHSAVCLNNTLLESTLKVFGLTTPKEHLLHHSLEVRGNYGNFVILWDKLFKTYQSPKDYDLKSLELGTSDGYDYLSAITFGFFHLNPKQKQKYQISEFIH